MADETTQQKQQKNLEEDAKKQKQQEEEERIKYEKYIDEQTTKQTQVDDVINTWQNENSKSQFAAQIFQAMNQQLSGNTNSGSSSSNDISESQFKLAEPPELNKTDPKVRHDGGKHSNIVKKYDPEDGVMLTSDGLNQSQDAEFTKIWGVKVPIIKINNEVIDHERILYMKLSSRDNSIKPMLTVHISDKDDRTKVLDPSSTNNIITVIIVPPTDGAYKKLSINFYCQNPKYADGVAIFSDCEYKLEELHTGYPTQFTHKSCDAKFCKTSIQDKPNTYELFHDIALNLGLGFAATDQVKEVEDRLIRNTQNRTLEEFMKQQIAISGLDSDSFFDFWIDIFGYLVVVNVAWVMSQQVTPNSLGIYTNVGMPSTTNHSPQKEYVATQRTINNYNYHDNHNNLQFQKYDVICDFSALNELGNNNHFFAFNPAGTEMGGDNNLSTFDVTVAPQSRQDTMSFDWLHPAWTQVLTEVNSYGTEQQRVIRTKYFQKLRASYIKVTLVEHNLGIERGMLVNFVSFLYDSLTKQRMVHSGGVLGDKTGDIKIEHNLPEGVDEGKTILEPSQGVPDGSVSGIYYVDGIEFEYDHNVGEIVEILYLIKQTAWNKLSYAYQTTFDSEQLEERPEFTPTDGGASENKNPTTPEQQKELTDEQKKEIEENQIQKDLDTNNAAENISANSMNQALDNKLQFTSAISQVLNNI